MNSENLVQLGLLRYQTGTFYFWPDLLSTADLKIVFLNKCDCATAWISIFSFFLLNHHEFFRTE